MRDRMFVDLRTIECRTNRSLHYTSPTHHSLPHTPLLPLYTQNWECVTLSESQSLFPYMLRFGCLDWDNHPALTTFSVQFFIVYSEGICHSDIPHAPLSFWDRRSVPSSPKDDRSRIRYGLSGTSTHEPMNVNDPIYTYIPRYVLHIPHNPISLFLPLHSSLLSIYVRVHIVNLYDHFHVNTYFIQWTWVWYVVVSLSWSDNLFPPYSLRSNRRRSPHIHPPPLKNIQPLSRVPTGVDLPTYTLCLLFSFTNTVRGCGCVEFVVIIVCVLTCACVCVSVYASVPRSLTFQ